MDESKTVSGVSLTPNPTSMFAKTTPIVKAQPDPKQDDAGPKPKAVKVPSAEEVAETIVLLADAKERLAANALSDVGYFIGRAIQLLEG